MGSDNRESEGASQRARDGDLKSGGFETCSTPVACTVTALAIELLYALQID